ncbi:MAG: hypothetical protein BMS9Abin13_607 [Patescibacteria group bacterium]|nr:MAG: hypothetical protein BMS9Abin13_607 [Patescibacteria group bacterium]
MRVRYNALIESAFVFFQYSLTVLAISQKYPSIDIRKGDPLECRQKGVHYASRQKSNLLFFLWQGSKGSVHDH